MYRRRSVPLLLMLLTVTAGLFAMHTLGHQSGHTGMSSASMPVSAPHLAGMTSAVVTDAAFLADAVADGAVDRGHQPGMPSEPGTLCLAILCTVLLVAIALVLLGRLPQQLARTRWLTSAAFATVRGPPPLRIGLRLADLSVLRN